MFIEFASSLNTHAVFLCSRFGGSHRSLLLVIPRTNWPIESFGRGEISVEERARRGLVKGDTSNQIQSGGAQCPAVDRVVPANENWVC